MGAKVWFANADRDAHSFSDLRLIRAKHRLMSFCQSRAASYKHIVIGALGYSFQTGCCSFLYIAPETVVEGANPAPCVEECRESIHFDLMMLPTTVKAS